MRSPNWPVRLSLLLATTSLSTTIVSTARAQQSPPPGAEQAGEQNTDPPALAGRLANLTGSVSFHASGEMQWSAATPNYPVTNGEAFWTEPQARATLEIADDTLVLDSSTELDVGALDQSQFTVTEAQGAVYLNLNSLFPNQTVTFNTPRAAVQITAPGRYEIVAGDTNDATMISVVEGAAHITGTNLVLDVGPQQTASIGGTDTLQGSVGALEQDAFLQSMLTTVTKPRYASNVPRQIRYMTGATDLETYGSFTQTSQYGDVWYPRSVPQGWAPYRDGHWAYVQPWGWTWVDNARWGFAPFHYGRWVQVDDRWGWVASSGGEVATDTYPVYSPALVSFVDVGGAALTGAAIGFAAGEFSGGYAPAWVPLGPREPYYPWYHTRADYFARVNAPYGVPQAVIERGPTYINNVHETNVTINRTFINERAATVVPASAFASGRPLAGFARPLPVAALSQARPVIGRMPVAPSAATPNLPPAVARRYNVSLPEHPVRPAMAGPRIEPPGANGRPVPPLRQAAPPPGIRALPAAQVRTGQPARPGQPPANAARLGAPAQPPLRAPEGRQQTEAGRAGGAPGPAIAPRAQGSLPALRAPGARPNGGLPVQETRSGDAARPALGGREEPGLRPNLPASTRPESEIGNGRKAESPAVERAAPPGGQRPADLGRPGAERPVGPGAERPVRPGAERIERPDAEPSAGAGGERHEQLGSAGSGPRGELARPVTHAEQSHPATRRDAPQPARAESPRPTQRAEPPRTMPHEEAPRPAPHPEAPRPAPRPEAARPAPRFEAARPAPHVEAPRPAPHVEAPRPAPHVEAPRAAAPRSAPAPHAAPPPQRRPGEKPGER